MKPSGEPQLADQVVVITGSSRGLGQALAVEFHQHGARVVVSSRTAEAVNAALRALPEPGRALGVPCDVRELEQVQALADAAVSKFGRIDVWINNAGISPGWGRMNEMDPARWRDAFETNFFGTYHGCRAALDKMLTRRRGLIVNILGAGADRPAPNQSAYGTAKAAVARLTQTLAIENADSGVSFIAVMPGMIWTEMLTRAQGVDSPRLRTRMEWAMRVFGNPPEVPARWIVGIAQRDRRGMSGKTYRLLTPRVFVPRMLGELLGAGKRDPRPWESTHPVDPMPGRNGRAV